MALQTTPLSVSYHISVNSELVGPIIPGRGIRQGDPLSPYLFIVCEEGLTALMKQAEARGDLHGVKIYWGAPIVGYLLFADDFFCSSKLRTEGLTI